MSVLVGLLTIGGFIGGLVGLVRWAAVNAFKQIKLRADELESYWNPVGLKLVDRVRHDATPWNVKREPVTFDAKADYPGVSIFKIYNCKVYNVLQGRDDRGRKVRIFDAQYTVSTGKSSHTYYYSFAAVDLNQPAPDLSIQPEGLWDKVKAMFGKHDLQVGNEEFDKRYRLECADEAFARSLIMSEMQEKLIKKPYDAHYITNGHVVVMRLGVAKPAESAQMLDRACFIADRVTNPEPMSQVRYALHHSSPMPNVENAEDTLQEFEEL